MPGVGGGLLCNGFAEGGFSVGRALRIAGGEGLRRQGPRLPFQARDCFRRAARRHNADRAVKPPLPPQDRPAIARAWYPSGGLAS